MNLDSFELDRLFGCLADKRFVVLGDFCLDAYYFLDNAAAETSVETGLRTNAVRYTRFTPGGAGNVAANLTAMGAAHVHALGVLGDDLFGREYQAILSSRGIDTDAVVVQKNSWHTCVYTKLYDDDKELPRIDIGNHNRLTPESEEALLAGLARLLPRADGILINQQLHNGIHTASFKKRLAQIIGAHRGKRFLLDARDVTDDYPGAVRKLNHREAVRVAGLADTVGKDIDHVDTVCEAARVLYRRWRTPVFVTRGERGGLVFDGQAVSTVPGLHFLAPIDTVGAGDSIFAGLAAGMAVGLPHAKALLFSQFVAGVTVQKLYQTGTASQEEIRALAQSPDFRHHPETAQDLRSAVHRPGSDIEIIRQPSGAPYRYAVFDHDGTISTLRQGWEAVMAPMMVKAILGDAYAAADATLFKQVSAEVSEFIDNTTGIQTLIQMAGLAQMVRDRGLVPQAGILSPRGYKKVYLSALNQVVRKRVNRLEQGDREVSDYRIKGAVRFLKALRGLGVTLFLASGTDDADVQREAALLGYAELFEGGIYGATDLVANEPKQMVLKKILADIGPGQGRRIVTFGDGPVEMRQAYKIGGTCVGVASDEIRRFGLNPDKRRRLILAGAEIIIPDFSQPEQLLSLLSA